MPTLARHRGLPPHAPESACDRDSTVLVQRASPVWTIPDDPQRTRVDNSPPPGTVQMSPTHGAPQTHSPPMQSANFQARGPGSGQKRFFFNCLARPRFWSPAPFPPLPLFTPSIATPRAPRPAADQTETACLIHCWQPTTQKQPVLWKLSFASFVRDCKPVPPLFFFVQNHVTKVSVRRKPLSPSLTSHASSWPWLFSCCRPRILHFRSQSTGSPPPLLFSNPDVEPCPKDLAVRPLVCVSLTRSPPPCEQSHSPRYCLQLPALPRSTRV